MEKLKEFLKKNKKVIYVIGGITFGILSLSILKQRSDFKFLTLEKKILEMREDVLKINSKVTDITAMVSGMFFEKKDEIKIVLKMCEEKGLM